MVKLGSREEWAKRTEDLVGKKNCPFCNEKRDGKFTIWEGVYWYIKINKHPYTGDAFHIMAVPKAHKEFSHELTREECSELPDVHTFVKKYYGEKRYFSFTRESFANRSVKHLHMHFLPGKISSSKLIESFKEQQSQSK